MSDEVRQAFDALIESGRKRIDFSGLELSDDERRRADEVSRQLLEAGFVFFDPENPPSGPVLALIMEAEGPAYFVADRYFPYELAGAVWSVSEDLWFHDREVLAWKMLPDIPALPHLAIMREPPDPEPIES